MLKKLVIITILFLITFVFSGCGFNTMAPYTSYRNVKVNIVKQVVTITSKDIRKNLGFMTEIELSLVNEVDTYNVFTIDGEEYIFDKIK